MPSSAWRLAVLPSGSAGVVAAVLFGLLAGCNAAREVRVPPPVVTGDDVSADSGAFVVAENMLDTWNTIGQILVGLDGVTYEGRAQMLGLYSVGYRDEHFLIRTQAVVISDASHGVHTRVDTLGASGKPTQSAAAVALLHLLEPRVPLEAARYRQRIKLRPDAPATRHPKTRKPGKP